MNELPPPDWREMRPLNPPKVAAEWWGRATVEAAVRAAVEAERERILRIVDDIDVPKFRHGGMEYDDTVKLLENIAAAIRATPPSETA